jgi:hypothetical protein
MDCFVTQFLHVFDLTLFESLLVVGCSLLFSWLKLHFLLVKSHFAPVEFECVAFQNPSSARQSIPIDSIVSRWQPSVTGPLSPSWCGTSGRWEGFGSSLIEELPSVELRSIESEDFLYLFIIIPVISCDIQCQIWVGESLVELQWPLWQDRSFQVLAVPSVWTPSASTRSWHWTASRPPWLLVMIPWNYLVHVRTISELIYTIFIPYLYHIYTWWGMDGSYLYHFIPWKSYGFDPSRGVFDRDIFEADKFHAASATDPGKAKDMLRLGNMPWWETEQAIIRWSFGKMPYRTSSWGCFICFTSQWKSWGLVVTVQWRTST